MPTDRRHWRRDLILVLILFLAGVSVKGWLVARTEVLARDGVGYIRFADRLEKEDWSKVLLSEEQHPLYPLHVLAIQQLNRPLHPHQRNALTWQSSAQAANLLAGVLLALPMFLIGRDLFDPRVGFWGALLFQLLPVPARVTADTLSEGTYLLWMACAVYFAIRAFQTRGTLWFALTGIAGGLAYLVRPEGVLVIALTGALLIGMQVLRSSRIPWLQFLACLGALGLAAILTAAPYWIAIGHVTNKPSTRTLINNLIQRAMGGVTSSSEKALTPPAAGGLLLASRFTDGVDGVEHDEVGPWFALYEVLDELSKAFYYVTWIPGVIGLVWCVRRVRQSPGLLLILLLPLVSLLVLWQLALRVHYVSERHTLLIVMCGCLFSAAALFRGADLVASTRFGLWPAAVFTALQRIPIRRRWRLVVTTALLVFLSLGLTQTLKPLHKHRLGHKLAGLWLAEQLQPGDSIVDPYALAYYYAGRRLDGEAMHVEAAVKKNASRYLLEELADRDTARRRLIAAELERMGDPQVVFAWPNESFPELRIYKSKKKKQVAVRP